MKTLPIYPSLLQINTRVWLGELEKLPGHPGSLDDIPESSLDEIARLGFDYAWLLGVWQTGEAGRQAALNSPGLMRECGAALPDYISQDVSGSPFAITDYRVHADLGGNEALGRLRERLRARGVRLLLDFVPNHTGLDHPWAYEHPEYYVHGSEADLLHEPYNYQRVATAGGAKIIAHGRDPYFPGWSDTLQLNYRHGGLRQAMIDTLLQVAGLCDGVRCDMAMLLLPEVIARTWGDKSVPVDGTAPADRPFWPEAIARVHQEHPDFLFMAEVYWDLEGVLQEQGFDYAYDKKLYDHLRSGEAAPVRAHLGKDPEFQRRSVRFLENHDEPRAASLFPPDIHKAAAVLTYLAPGLRFFHEGQLDGRRIRVPVQLRRRPAEPMDKDVHHFYETLLEVLKLRTLREGTWQLLECTPAWEGSATSQGFIAYSWQPQEGRKIQEKPLLVVVNYASFQGQGYLRLPYPELRGKIILADLLDPMTRYERDGNTLAEKGLYLDIPAWKAHVFEMQVQFE